MRLTADSLMQDPRLGKLSKGDRDFALTFLEELGKGRSRNTVTPNLSLPLTFSIALLNTSGQVVNTMTLACDLKTLQTFPQSISPSIVLAKADSALKSFSF